MVIPLPEGTSFELPEGGLCRSDTGWVGVPYRVNILIREGDIEKLLETILAQEGSLLGPGQLALVTENPEGLTTPAGMTYSGYLMFLPESVIPSFESEEGSA